MLETYLWFTFSPRKQTHCDLVIIQRGEADISYLYNGNSIENGNVASVSTAINDFIKELEKNLSLVSTANTNEI